MVQNKVQVIRNHDGEVVAVALTHMMAFYEFPNGGKLTVGDHVIDVPPGGETAHVWGEPQPEGAVMFSRPTMRLLIHPAYRDLIPKPDPALFNGSLQSEIAALFARLGVNMDPWPELQTEALAAENVRATPGWSQVGPWDGFLDTVTDLPAAGA